MLSDANRAEDAGRTNSTHDGENEPIKLHISEGFNITEAVSEYRKGVVGDYHRLNKLDNVDSIDEAFYGSSVLRKC